MTWWAAQLLDLVPVRFREGGSASADTLVAELLPDPSKPAVRFWSRRHRQQAGLGTFNLDDRESAALRALPRQRLPRRIVLLAPAAMLLERDVVLPAAAEPDWRNVVRYEMQRLTPFAADAVFWTGMVRQRDPRHGRITLRLSIVPRAALSPAIGALREAGLAPAAIEIAGPDGMRTIDLGTAAGATWHANGLRVLAGACAGLALLAIVLPFIVQSRQQMEVNKKIATLRPVVLRAEALRRRILTGSSSINVVARERARVGDPLAVLAALTAALPENTYLTELSLRHLKLDIAGQSTAAAPLLSALSANPALRDVAFSAPVTRDSTHHTDLFSIKALVEPASDGARAGGGK